MKTTKTLWMALAAATCILYSNVVKADAGPDCTAVFVYYGAEDFEEIAVPVEAETHSARANDSATGTRWSAFTLPGQPVMMSIHVKRPDGSLALEAMSEFPRSSEAGKEARVYANLDTRDIMIQLPSTNSELRTARVRAAVFRCKLPGA